MSDHRIEPEDSGIKRRVPRAPGARAQAGAEATAKAQMAAIIQDQPDDSSYDEVLRELAFYRMIQRGMLDARKGRSMPDAELRQRLRAWRCPAE